MSDYLDAIIIGAGNMAAEYSKILKAIGKTFIVFGRGLNSAKEFETKTGIKPILSNIRDYLIENDFNPRFAIVAVSLDQLADKTKELIDLGILKILVEKPGGLNFDQIMDLQYYTEKSNSEVFIAYNRRFYTSVLEAKEIIDDDDGVLSFNFEFTEWGHVIEKNNFSKEILENWFFVNSTHVLDLAFFLGGKPLKISSFREGKLDWHPTASRYCGAGMTENGALFNYCANWSAPGRWGIEVLTKKNRLIFRPLEKLFIQKITNVEIQQLDIDDTLDIIYKPGLFRQVDAFLKGNNDSLLSIDQQYQNLKHYSIITGEKSNKI